MQSTSRLFRIPFLSAVLLFSVPARGQDPTPPAPPGETGAPSPAAEEQEKKDKKKKDKEGGKLEWKGRVFARAAYEDTTQVLATVNGFEPIPRERLRLQIPSARMGLKYDVSDSISLAIEADVADNPLLRDAFVAGKTKIIRGRAGQFKMPVSSINLESPWTLPVARRGMIQDVLHDHMRILGRRPGVLAGVRGGGGLDPELSISAFQGGYLDAKPEFELINDRVDAQNLVGRFSITPGGQEIAVFGERVSTLVPAENNLFAVRHFWAAGADATLDEPFGIAGLRAWLEGFVGKTYIFTYDASNIVTGHADSTYWAGRAILAWRWGGASRGDGYLEPFAFYGILDPSTDGSDDMLWEAFVGLNIGFWRDTRLTLQFEMAKGQDGVPGGLFSEIRNLKDHKAFVLQAGAAF